MFDYSTLVDEVKRLSGNYGMTYVDNVTYVPSDTYYIQLSRTGYAVPEPSGVIINGSPISEDEFTVRSNIIRLSSVLAEGSSASVLYSLSQYSDEQILNAIGDTIRNYIQPLLNKDFGFEDGGTTTDEDVSAIERGLFVYGTAITLMGLSLLTVSSSSLKIKDGDTTLDTSVTSADMRKALDNILKRWDELVKSVVDPAEGYVMY